MRKKEAAWILAGVIAVITLIGCQGKRQTGDNQVKQEEPAAVIKEDKEQEQAKEPEASYIENLTQKDFSNFVPIKEAQVKNVFENTIDYENLDQDFEIKGSYDLNSDGTKDQITFQCNRDQEKAVLTINDSDLDVSCPAPAQAYLVDLDTRDSYLNVVLYDEGMSADPCYHFYQYDGKEIKPLGELGCLFEGAIGFDGYNRAANLDSFLNRLNPAILTRYYEYKNDAWTTTEFEMSEVEGKEYTISEDCDAYFAVTDQNTDQFEYTWAQEEMCTLHTGEKITIHTIGQYERYEVTMPDGRKGILYFWIGD